MAKFKKGVIMAGSVGLAPVFLKHNSGRGGAVSGIPVPSRSVGMDNSVYVPTTKGFYQTGSWYFSSANTPTTINPGLYIVSAGPNAGAVYIKLEMYSRAEAAWKTIDVIGVSGSYGVSTFVASSSGRTRLSSTSSNVTINFVRMGVTT